MDGKRLAGAAAALKRRICHAAGLYQRPAHGSHPGGSPDRRRDEVYPLLQVRQRAGPGGDRAGDRQRALHPARREDHRQTAHPQAPPQLSAAGRHGAGSEPCGRGPAHRVLVCRGGIPHRGGRPFLAAGGGRPGRLPQRRRDGPARPEHGGLLGADPKIKIRSWAALPQR